MPITAACLARSRVWAEARRAFEGMQPTLRQVPPIEFFSMRATVAFLCAHLIAAAYPPGPPPITITSNFSDIVISKYLIVKIE
jgi:hypothetical protein